jgi:hypothetical protein
MLELYSYVFPRSALPGQGQRLCLNGVVISEAEIISLGHHGRPGSIFPESAYNSITRIPP